MAEMSPTDRTRLYDAVRTARSTTATREEKMDAAKVQGELKKKYPDIYGDTRLELFNQIEAGNKEMSKGGMTRKKYNKGGYANCGASMAPAQKSSQNMMKGGYVK